MYFVKAWLSQKVFSIRSRPKKNEPNHLNFLLNTANIRNSVIYMCVFFRRDQFENTFSDYLTFTPKAYFISDTLIRNFLDIIHESMIYTYNHI